MSKLKRLIQEPLLHFAIIGAVLFALYGWFGARETEPADNKIVVTAGRIKQLRILFAKTWQRPPTSAELEGLIDDYVLEEVYYRQAVAMGIDRDDTVIRRRLRQKLEFISDETATYVPPTHDDLAAYLDEHPDKFREPPTFTFEQVYYNPARHGTAVGEFLDAELERLRAGDEPGGDPSLLPDNFENASLREIDGTFGLGFTSQLVDLEIGQWHGPLPSGLGVHLVRVNRRQPGKLPSLNQIRPLVEREWSNARRMDTRAEFNRRLVDEYEVVIEWPDEVTDESSDVGNSS